MSRTHNPNGRTMCVVLGDGTRLAVPPMRDDLPGPVRRQVFHYVLTRQPGLAHTVATIHAEVMETRERHLDRTAKLMAEQPYSARWAA